MGRLRAKWWCDAQPVQVDIVPRIGRNDDHDTQEAWQLRHSQPFRADARVMVRRGDDDRQRRTIGEAGAGDSETGCVMPFRKIARPCHLLLGQRRVKWVRVTRAVAHNRYEKRERLLFGE